MNQKKPFLVHDTARVLYADSSACALFHCEPMAFTARKISDMVVGEDFRSLHRVHMQVLRERGESPEIEYPFIRCDMSVFWAKVQSAQFDDNVFCMSFNKTFEEWW